ncbi:MAG: hypothetical protein KF774_11105 [Planctomyces sp.]|nr:hypothetical protein [Planctomyces sp.]
MDTVTTICGTNVNGVSVQTGGMVVGVAVRGDRALVRDFGKRHLQPSHRSSSLLRSYAVSATAAVEPAQRLRGPSIDLSMPRRSPAPTLELPPAAWAALVLARAA